MRVPEVDLTAELEDLLLGGGELADGLRARLRARLADLGFAREVLGRGGIVGQVQRARGLQRGDVILERVGQGVMQDGCQPAIDRLAEGLEGELGAVGVVQPGRGHDCGQAHARVHVAHRLLQEGDVVGELTEGMPDDVGGGGARLELLGLEQAPDEFAVGLVLRPGRPERFA